MKEATASDLSVGEAAIISRLEPSFLAQRLMSLGVIQGASISMIRTTLGGGCHIVKVGGITLALRNEELGFIHINKST